MSMPFRTFDVFILSVHNPPILEGSKNTENTRRNSEVPDEPSERPPSEPRTPTSPTATGKVFPSPPTSPVAGSAPTGGEVAGPSTAPPGQHLQNGHNPHPGDQRHQPQCSQVASPSTALQQNGHNPHPRNQHHQPQSSNEFAHPNQVVYHNLGPALNIGVNPGPLNGGWQRSNGPQMGQRPYDHSVRHPGGGVSYFNSQPSLNITGNIVAPAGQPLVTNIGRNFSVRNIQVNSTGRMPGMGGKRGKGWPFDWDSDIEEEDG